VKENRHFRTNRGRGEKGKSVRHGEEDLAPPGTTFDPLLYPKQVKGKEKKHEKRGEGGVQGIERFWTIIERGEEAFPQLSVPVSIQSARAKTLRFTQSVK